MKKNQKIFTALLSLGAVLSTYTPSSTFTKTRSEKVYNDGIKNLEQGKINKKNYQLLEQVLKSRNKELKDLYLQGDYIVKPEYLEWQLFFTAFYEEHGKGIDNSKENAKYHSKISGYYNENREFIVTKGSVNGMISKEYQPLQEAKEITLSADIPLISITKEPVEINLDFSVEKPEVSKTFSEETFTPSNLNLVKSVQFSMDVPDPIALNTVNIEIVVPTLNTYNNVPNTVTYFNSVQNLPSGEYKLSETTSGRNNAFMNFNTSNGGGDFYSETDTILIVDVASRRAATIDARNGASYTFTNKGTILLNVANSAGLEFQSDSTSSRTDHKFINTGLIQGNNTSQAAFLFTQEDTNPTVNEYYIFENSGTLQMNGDKSAGISIGLITNRSNSNYWDISAFNKDHIELNGDSNYGIMTSQYTYLSSNSEINNSGTITINGDKSVGIVVLGNSLAKFINSGIIDLNTTDNSSGIYGKFINGDVQNTNEINIYDSLSSSGIRAEAGTIINSSTGAITVSDGEKNMGMLAIGNTANVENEGKIIVNSGKNNVGVYLDNESTGSNSGSIFVDGENLMGISVTNKGNFSNTGKLEISGINTQGLYSKSGTISSIGDDLTINLEGEKSIGVFSTNTIIGDGSIEITGGNIILKNGGLNFFSSDNGQINLIGTNFETGENSLSFFTENSGKIDIKNSTGTIKSGGTAFYLQPSGPSINISNLLSNAGITIDNLTLNMEANSKLFSLDGGTINLSTVSGVSAGNVSGLNINGDDFTVLLLHRGSFIVDEAWNIDDIKIEMANSNITNNSIITTSRDNRNALAQENDSSNKNDVQLINNGEIRMTGSNSIGMYINNGIINNNDLISSLGTSSQGIYGVNGAEITNSGNIIVGDSGVGIAAQSYKTDETNTIIHENIDNGNFLVDHYGRIESAGKNAIGIYANNNDDLLTPITDKIVNLRTNSSIDLSQSIEKGIGVYLNKSTLYNDGIIKVGSNGVGVYSLGSEIGLDTNSQIDLSGDNSYGYILKDASSLVATGGTINVTGNNNTIFLIDQGVSVSGLDNIDLNINDGVSVTLASVKNNMYSYNGILNNLGLDSALIIGENSNIEIASGGNISSTNDKISILVASQGSAVNYGEINLLGSKSVGIYGYDGALTKNENKIVIGSNGAGIYNDGGTAYNNGLLEIGEKSTGVFGTDFNLLENNGVIQSASSSATGIYANNNIMSGAQITNNNNINLSNDKSIGIYSIGTNTNIINNNSSAEIKVGNSSDISNPSIGIYSGVAGSFVTNTGTISSGKKSIGIYNNGGVVNNNGISNIGNSGVGVYSINGTVNLNSGLVVNMGTLEGTIVYGIDSVIKNSANLNLLDNNYGFILKGGSFESITGTTNIIGSNSVFVYGTESVNILNESDLIMTGSNNVGFYTDIKSVNNTVGSEIINKGTIDGTAGKNNVGIYNYGGTIHNYGSVKMGDSDIVVDDNTGEVDLKKSKYSVGIYGENATIVNYSTGKIATAYGGYGVVAKGGIARNFGLIETNGSYSTGMYTEGGTLVNETSGIISINGDNTIGMYGKGENTQIINHGTINIIGDNAVGMYGSTGTVIVNTGIINMDGNSQALVSIDPSNPGHYVEDGDSKVNGIVDKKIYEVGASHKLPELINAGIIKTSGVLALDGIQVMIKPDPTTAQVSSESGFDFELSGTSIIADEVLTSKPIVIMPGFSDGTIANVYNLKGLVQAESGRYEFVSGSLLWEATPKASGNGVDVYMSRKSFTEYTDGLWFEDFGVSLEENFLEASGNGVTIYNKTGYIKTEEEFRNIMASLAGNVYSNINQRVNNINRVFENSFDQMMNSENNTKENIKISVIGGKGKNKEETDGVIGYDYTTTGVLALREVERTYRHTFGYSLGYLHTNFDFNDGIDNKESVDTIQLGFHNRYKANGWSLRNNLTGGVNFHNMERNIDWPSSLGRSQMDARYETYSIKSDNILGKEISLGKHAYLMPYGAFKATYITRPTFREDGLEALEIEGNDAWSLNPRLGMELNGAIPLGNDSGWQLKGTLDFSYEFSIEDTNEREKARLSAIENKYHKLSKPKDDKGSFISKAALEIGVKDRYGIALTGEYSIGKDREDDYRAGIMLKAVF